MELKKSIKNFLYEKQNYLALILVMIVLVIAGRLLLSHTGNYRTEWKVKKLAEAKRESKDTTSGIMEETDAWGRNLISYYEIDYDDLEHYKVVSLGPDGKLATEDDIICEKRDLTKWFIYNNRGIQRLIDRCERRIKEIEILMELDL